MDAFYQVDLHATPRHASAFRATEAIIEALRELIPITRIDSLLSESDHAIRAQARGRPCTELAAEEERLRERWDSNRRRYGESQPTAWPELDKRVATSTDNPFRAELWRGSTRVALQYRGVLLGRMNTAALRALSAVWAHALGPGFDHIRGLNICPAGGFIPWHSNARQSPGWRGYVIVSADDERGEFRYVDGDEVVAVPDRNATLNLFTVCNREPLFWHAVVSDTHRASCGFRLTDEAALRLLETSTWSSWPSRSEIGG